MEFFIFLIIVLALVGYLFLGIRVDKRRGLKETEKGPSYKLPIDSKKEYEELLRNVRNGVISSFPLDLNSLYLEMNDQLDFLSIDFETFTKDPLSAVSLGIIGVQSGKVVLVKEYFFNNPVSNENEFFQINSIYPEQVNNEPFFDHYWDEIYNIIEGEMVVIHNASFDLNLLQNLIDYYQLKKVKFRYVCTKNESQIVFQYAENCKLVTLAEEQQLPYWNHNALYDAFTASLLYFEIAKEKYVKGELQHFLKGNPFPFRKKKDSAPTILTRNNYSKVVYIQKDIMQMSLDFYRGQSVIVTGEFPLLDRDWIENHIEENGGIIRTSVSKKTFLLIHGLEPGPAKMNKIISINRERQTLGKEPSIVVSEKAFVEFLMIHGIVIRNDF